MLTVPEREPSASRWATRAALFSFGLIAAAAFLHRLFGMPTPVAFNLVVVALAVAGLSIVFAAIAAAIIWQTGRPGTARVLFAVCSSVALISVPLLYEVWVRDFPQISDITTDFINPPPFVAAARLRTPGSNSLNYDRVGSAEEQTRAYPDIKPVRIARPAEDAYALVVDAMKKVKMTIVRDDAPDPEQGTPGAIEAVDRTLIMGLYQDVAVRVSPEGEEAARVDIRSASRFGNGDMGRNAERIRELTKEILARVDATTPAASEVGAASGKRVKPGKADDPKSERRRRQRAREQ